MTDSPTSQFSKIGFGCNESPAFSDMNYNHLKPIFFCKDFSNQLIEWPGSFFF